MCYVDHEAKLRKYNKKQEENYVKKCLKEILQELKEIKKLLQTIASSKEQKKINIKLDGKEL